MSQTTKTQYVSLVDELGNVADITGGQLKVIGAGSGGVSAVDDSAFIVSVDSVNPNGFLADEVAPSSVNEGDVGIPRMTLDRKILMRMVGSTDANRVEVDASGNMNVIVAANAGTNIGDVTVVNAAGASAVNIQDGGNSITVDGTVVVSSLPTAPANPGVDIGDVVVTNITPGTGATDLGKAEDAVHTSGDVGVMILAVQQTADAALAADGDYAPLQVNATGALKVEVIETVGGGGVDPVGLKNIAAVTINPATEDTLVAGVAEHHNGTATTTPANEAFSGTSKSILIDNTDVSGDLLVSFDSGANTKTIVPGQSLSVEANHTSVEVSASAGTVSYEILVAV